MAEILKLADEYPVMPPFNPKRLIMARYFRGLTQKELSVATKINQASISLFERGKREPSDKQIEILVKTLMFKEDFFYKELQDYGPSHKFYSKNNY